MRRPSALRSFWRSMPLRSYLLFLTAVFCLFATFGFISDISSAGRASTPQLVFDVLFSGLVAAVWVVAGTKSLKALTVAVPLLAISIVSPVSDDSAEFDGRTLEQIQQRLEIDAAGTTIGVLLAYGCFIVFVATEGKRHLRVQTEIALARDLHRVIAPPIERRLKRFEFFGASIPSTEVGGDLVDVAAVDDAWTAYIADVSGHGLASGTLMAMFKSAMRSLLMSKGNPAAVLTDLNRVIGDLKRSNMFITCALLAYQTDEVLQFALAGHLPILHYQQLTRTIDELAVGQLPLGMFEEQSYRTAPVQFNAGDLFALLTDGLTEVFDSRDNEFGLERLKDVIAANADKPLADVFQAVIAQARRHGPQTDDQSLLLVRCL